MAQLIAIENISVAYPVKDGSVHTVFSGLDLKIEAGEFITLLGQTGCGKSTLLKLLLGSERPNAGTIRLDGAPVGGPDRHRGYVPQKYSLFPDKTVLENIAFGPMAEAFSLFGMLQPSWWRKRSAIRAEAMRYLQLVGLTERDAAKYPDQLSGGMQQRVAIAQSLMLHPRVLLMDESFSALDPTTRAAMQQLIRKIWREQQMTIVFVTHNLAEAVILGSRVILLAKDAGQHHSRVALDLAIPDYIRRPDGLPRSEELERISREIDLAGAPRQQPALTFAEMAS